MGFSCVEISNLVFVRFFQIMKALSTVGGGGAGRRTEGPLAPHGGGASALQVGRAGGLQVARRQPGVDDFEWWGGCGGGCGGGTRSSEDRQAGHQQQQQQLGAHRGPVHSAGESLRRRSSAAAATRAGGIAANGGAAGRGAPPSANASCSSGLVVLR